MSVKIDKALDNNDQKLSTLEAPANPLNPFGGRVGGGFARPGVVMIMPWPMNGSGQITPVRFKAGEKESKSLKELTGTISARVLSEAEQMITADKIMKADGKSFKGKQGGEIKVLKAVKKDDGSFEITFEFEMPANIVPETQLNVPGGLKMPNPQPLPPIRPLPPVKPGAGAGAAQAKVKPAQPAQPGVPAIAIARPIGVPMMNFAYNGLTLRDNKGNILPAAVGINFKGKGGAIFGGPGGGKMEYILTYRPAGKDAPEPAKLVFTGRRQIAVSIPFTLKNVELK
jgi:hypothetical protein